METKCILKVDSRLFPKEAIFKAAYQFIDSYYIFLSCLDVNTISISIESKGGSASMDEMDKKFGNELIAQVVRYNLSYSNKAIKNLILGRALYSAVYDASEIPPVEEGTDYTSKLTLDDIAVDWFKVHGNN